VAGTKEKIAMAIGHPICEVVSLKELNDMEIKF
jgi:hypothetical protein